MANLGQIYYNVLDVTTDSTSEPTPAVISNITASQLYTDLGGNVVTAAGAQQFNKVGIQAPPGTQAVLNGKTIVIGRTGIYELDDDIVITSMSFKRPWNYIPDTETMAEKIKTSTAHFINYEKAKQQAMRELDADFPEGCPDMETEPEKYQQYFQKYTEIQNRFIESYDRDLNEFNQGIYGVYMLDPDNQYTDLHDIIIDFVWE